MQAKVVLHLDEDEDRRLTLALTNMENLFKEVPPAEADVRMVANGTAVRLFRCRGKAFWSGARSFPPASWSWLDFSIRVLPT